MGGTRQCRGQVHALEARTRVGKVTVTVRQTTGGTPSTEFVRLAGLRFDRLSEAEVVKHIVTESLLAKGGWVFPVNVDVCRQLDMDLTARDLVSTASLIVPDGMPLVWAARLSGQPFPERVTGASLIFSLTEAAASAERSIYLLGGAPGVPDAAGEALASRYPGLKVAGTDSPPLGFDQSEAGLAAVRDRLLECGPDIVYVGMGFPKQEKLIAQLLPVLPSAWFIGCGAAIPFAAGTLTRAPDWMRDSGFEWLHRLASEPQRLVRRYLIHDLPYVARLLISACASRIDRKRL
jgi:N-acetylglucosaminyldiphosphoundecaprenol N-acetyl-beta-D-mannosaminyltransferase